MRILFNARTLKKKKKKPLDSSKNNSENKILIVDKSKINNCVLIIHLKMHFSSETHKNSLPVFNDIYTCVPTFCIQVLQCTLCWRISCFPGHSMITIQIKSEYSYDSSIQRASV